MRKGLWMATFAVFAGVLATSFFWYQKWYWPAALLLLIVTFIPFYARFEGRRVRAEEIVLLAELAAIAAVVRVPFAAIPSVQPTSFVVMTAGAALGGERGFLVGSMAALVSNIFLGQGPWTPWQMFAWGMMGLSAGLLAKSRLGQKRTVRLSFGFGWGLVFGWFMNLWYLCSMWQEVSWPFYFLACLTSLPMDLAHGAGNVLFLLLFERQFWAILQRIRLKYRL